MVTGEGRTKFQSEIVKQRALVDGYYDLPMVLLRKRAKQCGKLCNVDFVHGLNWIVENKPRKLRLY